MRVFVYRNLNRPNACWYSIKALEGPYKGWVVGYAQELLLCDVRFRVSEAGRQRVLSQRRRNVHAGIVGNVVRVGSEYEKRYVYDDHLCNTTFDFDWKTFHKQYGVPVTYNPYRMGSFVERKTNNPVYEANYASLIGSDVRCFNVEYVAEPSLLAPMFSLRLSVPVVQSFEVRS